VSESCWIKNEELYSIYPTDWSFLFILL